jgi:DNA-binding CsgD family transcriptional regulator
MMDMLPEEEDVIDFIKRGANGFIAKDAALEDLVNTIRQVANGGDVVPPALTGTLLSHIAKQASVLRNTPMMASVRMTKREQQITDLIAEGLSNKEIAQQLSIATYTVKSHVHNILEKLALHSRLQIAAHAHRRPRPKGIAANSSVRTNPAVLTPRSIVRLIAAPCNAGRILLATAVGVRVPRRSASTGRRFGPAAAPARYRECRCVRPRARVGGPADPRATQHPDSRRGRQPSPESCGESPAGIRAATAAGRVSPDRSGRDQWTYHRQPSCSPSMG